MGLDIGPKSV